jgi:hypothetical protein
MKFYYWLWKFINENEKYTKPHANEIYNSLKNGELKIIIEEHILESELEKK